MLIRVRLFAQEGAQADTGRLVLKKQPWMLRLFGTTCELGAQKGFELFMLVDEPIAGGDVLECCLG